MTYTVVKDASSVIITKENFDEKHPNIQPIGVVISVDCDSLAKNEPTDMPTLHYEPGNEKYADGEYFKMCLIGLWYLKNQGVPTCDIHPDTDDFEKFENEWKCFEGNIDPEKFKNDGFLLHLDKEDEFSKVIKMLNPSNEKNELTVHEYDPKSKEWHLRNCVVE